MRTRRIGAVTLGITMIVFGIAFLLQLIIPSLNVIILMYTWPLIFIFLGGEILWGNFREKEGNFIYDKVAILLIIILTFFAMFLAIMGNALSINFSF